MKETNHTQDKNDAAREDALSDETMEARPVEDVDPVGPGLMTRLRRLIDSAGAPRKKVTKAELGQDRTRSLVLLIGVGIGAVLLFFAVFSTPPIGPSPAGSGEPNLGRRPPGAVAGENGPPESVTPILSANIGSAALGNNQLSAEDILNTSTRDFEPDDPAEVVDRRVEFRIPAAPPETSYAYSSVDRDRAPERTRLEGPPTFSYGNSASDSTVAQSPGEGLRTSSIVFVRSPDDNNTRIETRSPRREVTLARLLLPPGSRLMARLESTVTTALNAPVVAAIEYNYERGGVIVVPAGAKAIGDLEQASADGYIGIGFHTLRMPDGREESIRAIAMTLDHGPLKGEVSGQNTVKKVLSRALSGIGTMAAYVVGAGGSGLSRPVTGGALLRDRLATNIAQAGEQEFASAAYSANIAVTIPAETRFYIVLEENAIAPPEMSASSGIDGSLPSVQELQELMDLKRAIDQLYGASVSLERTRTP